MNWGRFHLIHDDAGRYADIVDDRGVRVGSVYQGRTGQELYVDGEAIGALTEADLLALRQLMRERTIDREYGS